ncbi:DUF6894 family protein [Microvirga sp. CF3016]|uniref:DUF6894 family protein n=1 Tax=Microvirga sp. CF3016 TaxID=3110181 RepID=UPI002E75B0CC|nr:hypothetical protein [Microvirga sp. CF3016]MEE1609708.1 hypothetical protein [Microvirga sp. CF3016]
MPQFYFDVREGARFTPDEEGLELDSLDAAEREAAVAAAEIGRDRLPKGDSREIAIEVRDEHRQWVLTVRVSLEVDRVSRPPPRGPEGSAPPG